jgi:hypothetical protein
VGLGCGWGAGMVESVVLMKIISWNVQGLGGFEK